VLTNDWQHGEESQNK